MRDPVLGEVEVSGDRISFAVRHDQRALRVAVSLEGASAEEGLVIARKIVEALHDLVASAMEELVTTILPVVNGGYRDPEEGPLSAVEFRRCVQLRLVEADCEGNVSFIFDDGDSLWGHGIVATRDARSNWTALAFG